MKKLVALLLAGAMAFSLAACGGGDSKSSGDEGNKAASGTEGGSKEEGGSEEDGSKEQESGKPYKAAFQIGRAHV